MTCNPIDIACVLTNDLAGTPLLAMLFVALIYFIVASKLRFGFDTTFVFFVPFIVISAVLTGYFILLYAFAVVMAGLLLGWIVSKFIELR